MFRTLSALLLAGALPLLGHAQSQAFTASADAAVRADSLDRNFGARDLVVQRDDFSGGLRWRRSYLRFEVSGLSVPPECVTLELTEGADGPARDTHFEVRLLSGAWDEATITWNTAPAPKGRSIGVHTGPTPAEGETLRIPLDSRWIRADGTYDLALVELRSGGYDPLFLQSREDASPPRLVIGCEGLPPMAGFVAGELEGPVPFSPLLTNTSPPDGVAWLWDFGNGTTSSERHPRPTYSVPGRYDVRLTVTRADGSASCARPGMLQAYPADRPLGSVKGWSHVSAADGGSLPLGVNDLFGRSATGIGDLDGDGVCDIAVGAIGDDTGGNAAGAVWILFMEPDGSVREFRKISEGLAGFDGTLDSDDGFGRETASIGDWDGDGVPDLAIGANRDDDGGFNRGAVYLFLMRRDGSVKAWHKLSHGSGLDFDLDNGDEFGRGIARLEDMDGDGIPELAVSALGDDDGGPGWGAVWILYMGADGSVKSHAKLSATEGGLTNVFAPGRFGYWFGMHVAALGDVDGNGITDIGVGALLDNANPVGSGGLYVILLNPDGSAAGDHLVNAAGGGLAPGELESNDEFGGAVAGLGDVDGDGIPDVACAAIRDDDNRVRDTEFFGDWGAVYVLFLRADGTVRDYQKISATRGAFDGPAGKFDRIGEGLGPIGDFDGNGVPDLVLGTRFDDSGGSNKGAIYLLYLEGAAQAPRHGFPAVPGRRDVPSADEVRSPSRGAITPMGCGVNPAGSFRILSGKPRLGATLVIALDNPLGTQAPGAIPFVFASLAADPLFPCGTLRADWAMAGPGFFGEQLLDTAVPFIQVARGTPWGGPGIPGLVSLRIPDSPALVGAELFLQGRIADSSPGALVPLGLTDGVRLTLGQ